MIDLSTLQQVPELPIFENKQQIKMEVKATWVKFLSISIICISGILLFKQLQNHSDEHEI